MSEEKEKGIFTLAKQGSITFVGNILGAILGFLFIAIATRLVSPKEFGTYTLALSIVLFIQGFVSLHIYRSADYFIPQFLSDGEYGKAKSTLRSILLIGIVSSTVGLIFIFIVRHSIARIFDNSQLAISLSVLMFLIPIETIYRILISSFNGIKRMEYRILIKDCLAPISRMIMIIILITSGLGLMGLVGGHLIGIAITVIVGSLLLFYKVDWIREAQLDPVSNRSLVSYSLPLVLAGVIYSLVGQVDQFVIGYFISSADVGQYQVGFLLASNLLIALRAITPVFKPIVAENMNDNTFLEGRFRLTTRWIAIITIPPGLTLVLAPEPFLSLFFTSQYTEAATAVVALSIGYILNASFGPEGMLLEGLGHTRITLFNTFVLVSVNGILDIVLVPVLGILGAGIATGTALTIAGAAGVAEIYYLRGVHPFSKQLLRVWISAVFPLILGTILIFLLEGIFLTFILPVFIVLSFLMALRLVGGFTPDDAMIADHLDNQIGYPIFRTFILPDMDE